MFPDELKIARVIPIYKGGNSMMLNNYRPVSVLPLLSKIFERIINNGLIDHTILLKKLHKLGIRGSALSDWINLLD